MEPIYLSIEPEKTGKKIKKLLDASGYTVRDVQRLMGFNNPQAIYKWLSGKSLQSIDNFVILSRLLHTSIDNLLVVDGEVVVLWIIKLFEGLSILLRGGLEGLPLILMEFLRV